VDEHEFEPVRGLPEPLPPEERILWQGSPGWMGLARHAFHIPPLAVYFAALLVWRGVHSWQAGASLGEAAPQMATLALLAAFALGMLALLAWLAGRTAVYTITSRRIVMRIGIVLSVSFNLPFKAIIAAGLRTYRDGSGDITLTLSSDNKIAWLHLWPHVRPWRVRQPEPMLRSVADAAAVAALLREAVAAQRPTTAPAGSPAPADPRPSGSAALAVAH
jgi:hypothetical protein